MRRYHRLSQRLFIPREYLEAIHAEPTDLLELTVADGAIHINKVPSKELTVYKGDIAWLDEAYRLVLAHRMREGWAESRGGERLAYDQIVAGLGRLIEEQRYHAIDAAVQNLEPGRLNPWLVHYFVSTCQPYADAGLLPSWSAMLQKMVYLAYPERQSLPFVSRHSAEKIEIDPDLI